MPAKAPNGRRDMSGVLQGLSTIEDIVEEIVGDPGRKPDERRWSSASTMAGIR